MNYEFSFGTFLFGIVIVIAGAVLVRYYQQIADGMGSGVVDYDRYKLAGLIACGVGFIVMLNFHTLIFEWVFSFFFNR
ncbi:hypothetical protein H6796_00960 [Candidatus Nomurabacteria bacterium]|nr:hypothetical protein [Candidatus Nomurabacteria bacterium]